MRRIPALGPLAVSAKKWMADRRFAGSEAYWERHYADGGDSGPGSRGQLAAYKAGFVNDFVSSHDVGSVVELGCGDGQQLSLADYLAYTGLDVSLTALRMCTSRFGADRTKTFLPYSPGAFYDGQGLLRADLALSMDVLFHLVEDDVFETYLRDLFGLARRWVIIYASDGSRESSIGSVTNRPFTGWVARNISGWKLEGHVPNPRAWDGDVNRTTRSDFFIYMRAGAAST